MKTSDIKKIDIHAHAQLFTDYLPPLYNGRKLLSAEEMISFYDELGIEKGVLLPISSIEGQFIVQPCENAKYLTEKYPDRFLWFCNIDPRSMSNDGKQDYSELLAFYKSIGAKGVGEVTSNVYIDSPDMNRIFSACEELELPVLLHIGAGFYSYGVVDDLGLPRLERMLKAHPKLKFLGHSQVFWTEISSDNTEETRDGWPSGKVDGGRITELMREYGNLYCDFSATSGSNAMMRDPEHAFRFIEEFSDRILYGTDYCLAGQTFPYKFNGFLNENVENGNISIEDYTKLVRTNAEKLLKI
ncbi:MAG: amidohydrolase family protein [Clostridia bacterium]|nr:amidohydrolase family protein [Clostridia bacterium]